MKIIDPIVMTNSSLEGSSVSEDDYPVWSGVTTYDAEDRVIVIGSTHKIYESAINSNTGNNPVTDDGTKWIEVSATNRWKVFDKKLSDSTTDTGEISYVISAPSNITGLAIFNPVGVNLNITIETEDAVEVFNEDIAVADTEFSATDWLEYFTTDISESYKSVILLSVPGYKDNLIYITISGSSPSSPVSIGEIVLGYVRALGETTYGTSLSILDFSTKEPDTFGNFVIIERAFQDEVNFQFQLETANAGKVKRILSERRATPTVYFSDFGQEVYGAVAYGYYEDFEIPLSGPALSFATLGVRGLS